MEQTGCDSLAIAVGNAHGPYVKTPNLDLERIYAIRKKVNIPLVLHGCSDIPEEQMKEAVNLGMSKFNIATEYFRTMYQSIEKRINNQEFEGNGVKLMYDIKEEMIDFVIQKIRLLNPNKHYLFQAVMIPQFKIIKYMGLIDTKSSLVAVGIFNAFGTFLLRQFFLTIPKELEEAAKIDGCSYPRIFWEVILKNSKPALMTLIIFTFMNTWNDFLRPLIFINSEEKWTLAMGLAQFQGTYVSQWNQMMAGALISMLPILLVYIFAQKYFVQGIVMSGIKG